jgi:hypothetical protein
MDSKAYYSIINDKGCIVHVTCQIQSLTDKWGIWTCKINWSDGSYPSYGMIECDGETVKPESFIDNPEEYSKQSLTYFMKELWN